MTPPRPKRPRGRPAIDPTGTRAIELGVSLPVPAMNAVVSLATAHRVSVQEIIRRAIAKFVRDAARPARSRTRQTVTLARRLGI
jgi:hypothetical protein